MRQLAFILSICILFSSCRFLNKDRISGNGNIKTESRQLAGFHGLEVAGALDVKVTQDSAFSVKIEADDNLLQYILTEIDGSVLKVFPERGFELDGKITIHISAPAFRVLEASGASTIKCLTKISNPERISIKATGASTIDASVNAPEVFSDLSGASDVNLDGTARLHTIGASGASTVRAYELLTEESDVSLSGASVAQVFASVKLHASASGASDVKYKGNPALTSKASGGSDVTKVD